MDITWYIFLAICFLVIVSFTMKPDPRHGIGFDIFKIFLVSGLEVALIGLAFWGSTHITIS